MKKSLKLAAAGLLAALVLAVLAVGPARARAVGSWMFSTITFWNAANTTSVRFLGPLAAKPATSTDGDSYYDTVQHTICMATGTSTGNDKWLKANTATTGAAWTLY